MTDEFDALLALAEDMPDGPDKVALCERATALADAAGDREAGYRARLALTSAACFGGAPGVMLVAYAWLLAWLDESPGRSFVDEYQVLWRYKWVLSAVAEFPDYSLAQCEALLADLARRFAAAGAARQAVLRAEFNLARAFEDRPRARGLAPRVRRARPGYLSDCEACRANGDIAYQFWLGRPAAAVKAAKPILEGNLTCHAVPRNTYADLLLPHFARGELAEAMACHRAGYRLVARVPGCVEEQARHAEFLALTGNLPRAAQLVGKHLGAALACRSPDDRLVALQSHRVALYHLREAGAKSITLKMDTGATRLSAAEAFGRADAEARDLARRFDARNGNAARGDALAESLARGPNPYPYAAPGEA